MATATATIEEVPAINIRATTPEAISQVAQELERISKTARDYLVPAGRLRYVANAVVAEGEVLPRYHVQAAVDHDEVTGTALYDISRHAHRQMGQRLNIHANYMNKMIDERAGDLEATNVNYWLAREKPNAMILVRTLDGRVRAFQSNVYRIIDNFDLFLATYQKAMEMGAVVVRLDLTEERFYMRLLHPEWRERIDHQREWQARNPQGGMQGFNDRLAGGIHKNPADATVGDAVGSDDGWMRKAALNEDWVVPGAVVSNSEIGLGAVSVEQFVLRYYCDNGAIFGERFGQRHVGPRKELEGLLSAETVAHENAAIYGTVKDVIAATFDRERFLATVRQMSDATGVELESVTEATERVVAHYDLPDLMKQRILDHIASEGDPTVFGMMQALTAIGREQANYNRGVEFERMGPDFLERAPELVRVRK